MSISAPLEFCKQWTGQEPPFFLNDSSKLSNLNLNNTNNLSLNSEFKNTQIHLLLEVSLSFGLSFITPFFIYLLFGLFIIPSLKKKYWKMYDVWI